LLSVHDVSFLDIAYLFRTERQTRPLVLLGAGASYRSGIPLADEAVREIARAAYARSVKGLDLDRVMLKQSDWLPWLQHHQWFISEPIRFAENFPHAVEHLLTPPAFRREFFLRMIQPKNGISPGYHSLARMIARRLCWTVLTTNFDSLLYDALQEHRHHIKHIDQINRTRDDLVAFNIYNRCQIVYLHGAVEFYRDKNLPEETRELDRPLLRRIRPLLNDSPLIVVGYRGAETSIMHDLLADGIEESNQYRHGIYWCQRHDAALHPNVSLLQQAIGPSFRLIPIDGFDELFQELEEELGDEAWQGGAPIPAGTHKRLEEQYYDYGIEGCLTVADLDHELILATLTEYCTRLRQPAPAAATCQELLQELGLLRRHNEELRPTVGCYLLFGQHVTEHFPYARAALTRDHKRRIVFEGNLLTQLRNITDALSTDDINPTIRVKRERTATDQPAYPPRAITELVVNMLVHRDYRAQEVAHIEHIRGNLLRFANPGGLTPKLLQRLQPDKRRRFVPKRAYTDLRNPSLADIFYGIGSMDKEGTGLADVYDMMIEAGGSTECTITENNKGIQITLRQAATAPDTTAARPRHIVDLYTTNLLPFAALPRFVSVLPLRERGATIPLLLKEVDPQAVPLFLLHSDQLLTFADLRQFESFAKCRGHYEALQQPTWDEFQRQHGRQLLVWLVHKHFEYLLHSYPMIVEPRRKRAYFVPDKGGKRSIPYHSRTGKKTTRTVVKPRDDGATHENEAVCYRVVELNGWWALQLKPTYVFTKADGRTPVSSLVQTSKATRRFRFDRNKNVDDDLTFWARYLAAGKPTISLGNTGVNDLVLAADYCAEEIPIFQREAEE